MKKICTHFLSMLMALSLCGNSWAQEIPKATAGHSTATSNHEVSGHAHSMKGSHRFTLGLGHTQISQGIIDNDRKWLSLASWSLNYDYWVHDKWALGLQSDIIIESFVVEHGNEETLERSYPIAIVPVVMFKPGKHFSFILGAGTETAQGHAIGLTRLGVEYGKHLPKDWEIGIALIWDNKWNFYNSWGLAFTVSKIWPKKHR
jgi:hypothetical protein